MNCFAFSIIQSKRICKKVRFFGRFMCLSSLSSVQSLNMSEENNTHYPNYVELRNEMQNLANSGYISEALEVLHGMRNVPAKPTIYDYNSLINCYIKSKNVVLDNLLWSYDGVKRLGLHPNALTFNTLLKGLTFLGKSKEARLIVLEMCDHGFEPSFSILSNLLKKTLDSMDLPEALNVLELMLGFNYIPTEPKMILLTNSLCRCGMIQDAYFVFLKLVEKGYFGNVYIYNPILWGLCKSNQIYLAVAFFCYLKKKGLVFNVYSYTALVYGFSKEGLFKDAFRCLNIMENDGGCCPNVITYTTIIKCLCDEGRIIEALGILDKMEKKGCDPDIVTYNIILRELCDKNMVFEICELFRSVGQKGLSPDRYTYTALSGLLKRGNIGISHIFLLDILSFDGDVDVAVYNVYFHSLCRAHKTNESLYLIKFMIQSGMEPNNVTYNTILKGICEEKNVDEALGFLDRIEWPEKGPDLVSFNTILSFACKNGELGVVNRVLNRMELEGIKVNVVSLTCLMQYFANLGKIYDCLKIFEHMVSNGPCPSVITINVLMVNLCKNRELGAAVWVFSNLANYGLSPDSRTFEILIWAALNEGNIHIYNIILDEIYKRWKLG